MSKGIGFILSAPAGTGKTTIVEKLKKEYPRVQSSISFTTRKPREGEKNGEHYYFISKEEFENKIEKGDFLEYVTLFGEYYGTDKQSIEKLLNSGKHVFLVIDTEGAMKLKNIGSFVYIFVSPPSFEILKSRLTSRNTESPSVIEERLSLAEHEIAMRFNYDYQIINDDLEASVAALKSIIIAEEHKTRFI